MMKRAAGAEDASAGGRRPELDRALLLRCRDRDPTAFQAFVVRYERLVFAVLSQMLGHGPHVEDLAQETFLRAYLAFPRFDPDGAPPSRWLLTIAARLALNEKRRGSPRARAAPEPPESVDPETERGRHELGRAIERAISQLSDEHRVVFVLAELEQMTVPEIADALELNSNTIYSRLRTARQQFDDAVARHRARDVWRFR